MKKLLASVVFAFVFLTQVALPASAQSTQTAGGPWYDQTFAQWFAKVYDETNPQEIFGERYTAAQVQWIIYSLAALPFTNAKDILNCSFTHDAALCAEGIQKLTASIQNSPAYANAKPAEKKNVWLSALTDDRPISGIGYVKDTFRKFHIIPEAKAQTTGFGYSALAPVRDIWATFRNMSYLLFTVIIIAFAFMIMFRVKISPQTVISVQSALPKLIGGLILVTFSYAIAGFMIDLMYVVIAIIASTFRITGWGSLDSGFIYSFIAAENSLGLMIFSVGYVFMFLITLVFALFYNIVSTPAAGFALIISGFIWIISIIAAFILALILIWKVLKIIWMLIKTVASIFMLTIFAPIQITFGMISPGNGFGSWLKNFAATLAVFPITGLLLILSLYFLWVAFWLSAFGIVADNFTINFINSVFKTLSGNNLFTAINFNYALWNVPLLGSGFGGLVFLGASFSILSIVPKANELIQSFIAGKPFAYGTAIGETVSGPGQALMGLMNVTASTGRAVEGLKSIGVLKQTPKKIEPTGQALEGPEDQVGATL